MDSYCQRMAGSSPRGQTEPFWSPGCLTWASVPCLEVCLYPVYIWRHWYRGTVKTKKKKKTKTQAANIADICSLRRTAPAWSGRVLSAVGRPGYSLVALQFWGTGEQRSGNEGVQYWGTIKLFILGNKGTKLFISGEQDGTVSIHHYMHVLYDWSVSAAVTECSLEHTGIILYLHRARYVVPVVFQTESREKPKLSCDLKYIFFFFFFSCLK